jgi:hypothetical protein
MEKTEAIIKKVGSKWCVFSHDGTKNLGCSDSHSGAVQRLAQVEYFKKVKGMNYANAFKNMAKALKTDIESQPKGTDSLENKMRRGTIAGQRSGRLLDNADHFPVLTLDQAKSSLHRAFTLTAVPVWYNGQIDQLREEVYVGAVGRYPALANFNVKVPAEQAVALSDGQIAPETKKSGVKDPADVKSNEVGVKRPNLSNAAEQLYLAAKDDAKRLAMAGDLILHLEEKKEAIENAMKVANRLMKKGLTADEFNGLISFLQEDVLRSLLMSASGANASEAEARRQELLSRLGPKND